MEITASESNDKAEQSKPLPESPSADDQVLSKEEQIKKTFLELCRKYAQDGSCRTRTLLCLECGYKGEMPVAGKKPKSVAQQFFEWFAWIGSFVLLLLGSPIFFIFLIVTHAIGYIRGEFDKVYVVCPSCKKKLGPV